MAARSRPRGGLAKEDEVREERNMWNQIVSDMTRLKSINTRAAEVSKLIVEGEEKLSLDSAPPVVEIDILQDLYREGVKLAEEEQKILKEDPNGAIQNIGILSALRDASEIELPRSTANLKGRNTKRKLDGDSNAESPVPSPSVASSTTHSRLKGSSGRSGSVPSIPKEAKEMAVKMEEPSLSAGAEGVKGNMAEKAGLLIKGAEVAYKQSKQKGIEGEWIQCTIISVSGEGKQKRFEVQDPEPDENGAPGQIYKTTAAALIPIPAKGTILSDYPK
ncbi:MAG: SAGA HAT/Core module component, partial [Sclerophora amabilis]